MPADQLIQLLPAIQPRLYSIACDSAVTPGEVLMRCSSCLRLKFFCLCAYFCHGCAHSLLIALCIAHAQIHIAFNVVQFTRCSHFCFNSKPSLNLTVCRCALPLCSETGVLRKGVCTSFLANTVPNKSRVGIYVRCVNSSSCCSAGLATTVAHQSFAFAAPTSTSACRPSTTAPSS